MENVESYRSWSQLNCGSTWLEILMFKSRGSVFWGPLSDFKVRNLILWHHFAIVWRRLVRRTIVIFAKRTPLESKTPKDIFMNFSLMQVIRESNKKNESMLYTYWSLCYHVWKQYYFCKRCFFHGGMGVAVRKSMLASNHRKSLIVDRVQIAVLYTAFCSDLLTVSWDVFEKMDVNEVW